MKSENVKERSYAKMLMLAFAVMLVAAIGVGMVAASDDSDAQEIVWTDLGLNPGTDNITARFDPDATTSGTLYIEGTGQMKNWNDCGPWKGYSMMSVDVADGITSIGNYAFNGCTSIQSVNLGKVTAIGDYAFYGTYLGSLTVPDTVISIGKYAFGNNTALSSLNLGNGVQTIGECAFVYDYSISSLTIPSSVRTIGDCAFDMCSLADGLVIENGVTDIGIYAFWRTGLKSVTLPASVTSLGKGAFSYCPIASISVDSGSASYSSVDGVLYDKAGDTLVQYPAGKTGDVVIPSGVKTIGICAFIGNSNLTEIDIPSNVETIGEQAFYECSNLRTAVIGSGVTAINDSAFANCSLNDITIYSTSPGSKKITCGSNAFGYAYFMNGADPISINSTSFPGYRYAGDSQNNLQRTHVAYDISAEGEGNNVTALYDLSNKTLTISGTGAMADWGYLEQPWYEYYSDMNSAYISDGVTNIGEFAFCCMGMISSVTIPESILTIGRMSFFQCSALGSVAIPDNVTSIGYNAFNGCSGLASVTIGSSVQTIDENAFCSCSKLTSVTIPNSVTSIGDNAFSTCEKLETAAIGSGVRTMDSNVFSGCTSLSSITVDSDNGYYSSDSGVLFNKSKTELIIYPTGKTDSTYTVPNTVTKIDSNSFYCCNSISSITIPSSVTTIESNAFYECSILIVTVYSCTPGNTDVTFAEDAFSNKTFYDEDGKEVMVNSPGFPGYEYLGINDLTREQVAYDISATSDDYVTALYDLSENTLTISGTGKMKDWGLVKDGVWYVSTAPWCKDYSGIISGVVIGDGVTNIGDYAFYYCGNLKNESGRNISDIGDYAFAYSAVELFEFNSDLVIGDYAFYCCAFIKTDAIYAKSIGEHAFSDAKFNADNEYIYAEEIKDYAFNNTNCYKISINDATSIGTLAFGSYNEYGGPSEVFIGKSVTADISPRIFAASKNIQSYTVDPDNTKYSNDADGVLFDKAKSKLIMYPLGRAGAYVVPNTVTDILGYSACECSGLTSITIPSSVKTIGERAFDMCDNLTSVTVYSKNIGTAVSGFNSSAFDITFMNADGTSPIYVDSPEFPGHTYSDTDTGFRQTAVAYDISGGEEGDYVTALYDLEKNTLTISGTGKMKDFESCFDEGSAPWYDDYGNKMAGVTISSGVTNIGDNAFRGCSKIASASIADTVTDIGDAAFQGCTKLATVSIPSAVVTIGSCAFFGCPMTSSIVLGDSLKTIGSQAFHYCGNIQTVSLCSGVETIGSGAFESCHKLTSITVDESNNTYASSDGILFEKSMTEIVQYPAGRTDSTYTIPNYVKYVDSNAFYGCQNLTSVIIPATVIGIGPCAFGCNNLLSVTVYSKTPGNTTVDFDSTAFDYVTFKDFGGSTVNVNDKAFPGYSYSRNDISNDFVQNVIAYDISASSSDNVTALYDLAKNTLTISGTGKMKDWTLAEGVPTAPWYVDYHQSLCAVDIDDDVTNIGSYAFYGCSALKSEAGLNVSKIGDYAFYQSGIERFESRSDTVIGDYAFYGCINIESEGINAKSIGDYAFAYVFFEAVKVKIYADEIGDYAFSDINCQTISIDGVTSIGTSVFCSLYENSGPTEVIIGDVFTANITAGLFTGSKRIQSYSVDSDNTKYTSEDGVLFNKSKTELIVYPTAKSGGYTVPNTVTKIDGYAFTECEYLDSITIPSSVKTIESYAFTECGILTVTVYSCTPGNTTISFAGNAFSNKTFYDKDGNPVEVNSKEFPGYEYFGISDLRCDHVAYDISGEGKGDYVTALYDIEHNTVAISGTGNMKDTAIPWGEYTFMMCSAVINDGVTNIGNNAFNGCASLSSVQIGSTVKTIGTGAFLYTGIESVIIPNSVETIGSNAFSGISYLKSLTLGSGLKTIGSSAFASTGITSVAIPNSVDTIGDYAFNNCTSLGSATIGSGLKTVGKSVFAFSGLTSVSIPNSIETIDECAFNSCTSLGSVTIGSGVKTIGDSAFSSTGLTSVSIPNNVETVGDYAFSNCGSLASVSIGTGITVLNDHVFYKSALTSVTIPANVETVGTYAFSECSGLKTVSISEGVKTIEEHAFSESGITGLTIPNSVISIGTYSFYSCGGLESVTIGTGLKTISENAFTSCSKLASLSLGSGVETIGLSSFASCGLKSLTIPGTVKQIAGGAFNNCTSLAILTIEYGVTSIDNEVFGSCTALKNVTVYSKEPGNDKSITIGETAFDGITFKNSDGVPIDETTSAFPGYTYSGTSQDDLRQTAVAYDISATSDDHVTALYDLSNNTLTISGTGAMTDWEDEGAPWYDSFHGSLVSVTINEGVTKLGYSAFYGCTELISASLPNTLTFIGNKAFYGCEKLSSVSIPSGLKTIQYSTFLGCKELSEITLPSSLESIEPSAFEGCSNLLLTELPSGVISIYESAFKGCTKLALTSLPSGLGSLEMHVFDGCTNLALTSLPSGMMHIDEYAFCGCANITLTSLPNNLQQINDHAFQGCTKLALTSLPSGVTDIWGYAFQGCSNLALTSIPEGITNIGEYAFQGCTKLALTSLPSGVTSIPENAFQGCSNLALTSLPEGITDIGDYAFDGCTKLALTSLPNGVTSIPEYAFRGCASLVITSITCDVIEESAFEGCTSISSIVISAGIEEIWENAFKGCTSLKSVTVYSKSSVIPNIDPDAFDGITFKDASETNTISPEESGFPGYTYSGTSQDCLKQTAAAYDISNSSNDHVTALYDLSAKTMTISGTGDMYRSWVLATVPWKSYRGEIISVTISDGVTNIGQNAFNSCTALSSVTVGKGVTDISTNAFCSCTALGSITIGSGVTEIGIDAFRETGLTSVTVPGNVKTLCNGAFCKCTKLVTAALENGVETIDDSLFNGCTALKTVSIPASVKSMTGNYIFLSCTSLESISVDAANQKYCSTDGILFNKSVTEIIQYPGAKTGTSYTVPATVTCVGANAFSSCKNLTSVILPAGVSEIKEGAFNSSDIEYVFVHSVTPATLGETVFASSVKIIVPFDNLGTYKTSWSAYASQIYGMVDVPTAVTDLVYNGKEQTGVAAKDGAYTVTDGKKTDAGNYTAVVKLVDDVYWTDSTDRSDKNVDWSISKAKITALDAKFIGYDGETKSISFTKETGVNSESLKFTYTASSVAANVYTYTDSAEIPNSYTVSLNNDTGLASNYEVYITEETKSKAGDFTIAVAKIIRGEKELPYATLDVAIKDLDNNDTLVILSDTAALAGEAEVFRISFNLDTGNHTVDLTKTLNIRGDTVMSITGSGSLHGKITGTIKMHDASILYSFDEITSVVDGYVAKSTSDVAGKEYGYFVLLEDAMDMSWAYDMTSITVVADAIVNEADSCRPGLLRVYSGAHVQIQPSKSESFSFFSKIDLDGELYISCKTIEFEDDIDVSGTLYCTGKANVKQALSISGKVYFGIINGAPYDGNQTYLYSDCTLSMTSVGAEFHCYGYLSLYCKGSTDPEPLDVNITFYGGTLELGGSSPSGTYNINVKESSTMEIFGTAENICVNITGASKIAKDTTLIVENDAEVNFGSLDMTAGTNKLDIGGDVTSTGTVTMRGGFDTESVIDLSGSFAGTISMQGFSRVNVASTGTLSGTVSMLDDAYLEDKGMVNSNISLSNRAYVRSNYDLLSLMTTGLSAKSEFDISGGYGYFALLTKALDVMTEEGTIFVTADSLIDREATLASDVALYIGNCITVTVDTSEDFICNGEIYLDTDGILQIDKVKDATFHEIEIHGTMSSKVAEKISFLDDVSIYGELIIGLSIDGSDAVTLYDGTSAVFDSGSNLYMEPGSEFMFHGDLTLAGAASGSVNIDMYSSIIAKPTSSGTYNFTSHGDLDISGTIGNGSNAAIYNIIGAAQISSDLSVSSNSALNVAGTLTLGPSATLSNAEGSTIKAVKLVIDKTNKDALDGINAEIEVVTYTGPSDCVPKIKSLSPMYIFIVTDREEIDSSIILSVETTQSVNTMSAENWEAFCTWKSEFSAYDVEGVYTDTEKKVEANFDTVYGKTTTFRYYLTLGPAVTVSDFATEQEQTFTVTPKAGLITGDVKLRVSLSGSATHGDLYYYTGSEWKAYPDADISITSFQTYQFKTTYSTIGAAKLEASVISSDGSKTYDTNTVNFTVVKGAPVYDAPKANELVYSGSSQILVTAGSTDDGKLMYCLTESGTYAESLTDIVGTDAGKYAVYYYVKGDDNHNDTSKYAVNVMIAKAQASVSGLEANNLTYSGSAQSLTTTGTATFGTINYKLGTGSYGTSVPSATDAGTYYVYYKVDGTSNYYGVSETQVIVTIAKAASTVSAPTAKTLTYSGSALALVNAGTSSTGTVWYKLGDGAYSTSIPTAVGAGSYNVYYKVVGDSNHNDLIVDSPVSVTIAKATPSVTAPVKVSGLVYSGSAQALATAGSTTGGIIMYALAQNGTYYTEVPFAVDAGTYSVYYKVVGDSNYKDVAAAGPVSCSIAKATPVLTAPVAKGGLIYNGASQELCSAGLSTGGTVMYRLGSIGDFVSSVPSAVDAGTEYTVYYKVVGGTNYSDLSGGSIACSIAKATPKVTAPAARTGLVYSGTAQALITPGTTDYGTMKYMITGDYSDSIPTGTNATSYAVNYKVEGDGNHNEVTGSVSVTISRATAVITGINAKDLVYNGSAQELVTAGKTNFGNVQYSLTDSDYLSTVPKGTDAGSYTVYYRVTDDLNYYGDNGIIKVTIAKKDVSSAAVTLGTGLTYTGVSQTQTVSAVTMDGRSLTTTTDYTVSQNTGLNAGKYTLSVFGTGNYCGTASVDFTIAKKALADSMIEKSGTYTYSGAEQSLTFEVKDGTALTASDWCIVSGNKGTDAATYTLVIAATELGNYSGTAKATWSIGKADASFTAPSAISGLVYNGAAQKLTSAGSANGGTILYSMDGTNYSVAIPSAVNADTYTVYYKLDGGSNFNDVAAASLNAEIAKATPKVTAPTVRTGLVYTGNDLELINTGNTDVGALQYSIDDTVYSASTPVKTAAGSFTVYYKLADLTSNYNDVSGTVSGTIAKAQAVITGINAKELIYNASVQELITYGSTTFGTIQYNVDSGSYGLSIPVGKDAKTYTVGYQVIGNDDYNGASGTVSVAIAPKDLSSAAVTLGTALTYTGSEQTQAVSKVVLSGTELAVDTDYTVTDSKGTKAGDYELKVNGIGNYCGTADVAFAIAKKALADSMITVTSSHTYSGAEQTVLFIVNDGSALKTADWYVLSGNKGTDAATYTLVVAATEIGNYSGSAQKTWTIAKANASFTAPTEIEGLIYSGAVQKLVSPGSTNGGTILYSTDGTDYSAAIPSAVDADTYRVYYKLSGGSNFNDIAADSFDVEIAKATPKVAAPTARTGLVYTGYALELINTGNTDVGKMVYSINGGEYSEATPVKTSAATYTVGYQLSAFDEDNYNNVTGTVDVIIAKAQAVITGVTAKDLTYNTSDQELVTAGTSNFGEVQYKVGTAAFSSSVPTGHDAKTYTVIYRVAGTSDYNAVTSSVKVVIAPKDISSAAVKLGDALVYTGETQTKAVTEVSVDSAVLVATTDYTVANNTATDAGSYELVITGTGNYCGSVSAGFDIAQKALADSMITTSGTYTYTGDVLTVSFTVKDGTALTSSDWGVVSGSTGINAGSYVLRIAAFEDGNYFGTADASWSIGKADVSVSTPVVKTGLVYTGSALELITAGTVSGGELLYSLNGESFKSAIPTAVNAGSYPVSYKVIADDNHNGVDATSLGAAVIDKAESEIIVEPVAKNLTYNERSQELIVAGRSDDGTMKYKLGEGEYSTKIPAAVNAGTYTVYYMIAGDENHKDLTGQSVIAEIDPYQIGVRNGTVPISKVYDGTVAGVSGLIEGKHYVFFGMLGTDVVDFVSTANTFNDSTVNATEITIDDLTLDDSNYVVKSAVLDASITQKSMTVSVFHTKSYDGSVLVHIIADTDTSDLVYGAHFTAGRLSTLRSDSGTYTVKGTDWDVSEALVTDDGIENYSVSYSVTLTISKSLITVTPNSGQTKAYTEKDPVFAYTYSGAKASQEPGFSGALTRDSGENIGSYEIKAGNLALIDNGAFLAANYDLVVTEGVMFEITKKVITKDDFTVDLSDEVYTGKEITKTVTSDLVINTDYTVTYADNKDVGTASVNISGIGNYDGVLNYTFRIVKRTVDVPEEKYYIETGSEITFDIPTSEWYAETSGTPAKGTAAGTYAYQLTLDQNCQWSRTFDGVYHVYITQKEVTSKDASGNIIVKVTGTQGIRSDYTLGVKIVDSAEVKEKYKLSGNVRYCYDISFTDKDGKEIQPEGILTVTMYIPDELRDVSFSVYHIHGDVKSKIDSSVSGQYITVTTDNFSLFAFVENEETTPYWYIVIAVIVVVLILVFIIFFYRGRNSEEKEKKKAAEAKAKEEAEEKEQ